jgi:hypothetical protein
MEIEKQNGWKKVQIAYIIDLVNFFLQFLGFIHSLRKDMAQEMINRPFSLNFSYLAFTNLFGPFVKVNRSSS